MSVRDYEEFLAGEPLFKIEKRLSLESSKKQLTPDRQARLQKAITKQHALALLQSGKAATMEEAMAEAMRTSSPPSTAE